MALDMEHMIIDYGVRAPHPPPTETMVDVLRRAAERCEGGVSMGPTACIWTRVAQAHQEITGQALGWTEAGVMYAGNPDYRVVAASNDIIRKGKDRRYWAIKVLLAKARQLETQSAHPLPRDGERRSAPSVPMTPNQNSHKDQYRPASDAPVESYRKESPYAFCSADDE